MTESLWSFGAWLLAGVAVSFGLQIGKQVADRMWPSAESWLDRRRRRRDWLFLEPRSTQSGAPLPGSWVHRPCGTAWVPCDGPSPSAPAYMSTQKTGLYRVTAGPDGRPAFCMVCEGSRAFRHMVDGG